MAYVEFNRYSVPFRFSAAHHAETVIIESSSFRMKDRIES